MKRPTLLIFASGTKAAGGSGFKNLVTASKTGILDADIVGVVSNHRSGGVHAHANAAKVPFHHFTGGNADEYQTVVDKYKPDYVALSGWLKLTQGLDPKTTFNIHPGPLPQFGGPGLYGHHVHEAVLKAYKKGEIMHSGISMHFVTDEYDEGPLFFSHPVKILANDTPESLGARINKAEQYWQPIITNQVVHGRISWDGVAPRSLTISQPDTVAN